MPGVALNPGDGAQILASAARTPATPFQTNSDDFWLPRSGGLIIQIDITAGSGTLTHIRVQDKDGTNYDTVIEFALAMSSANRYKFLIGAGASAPGSWSDAIATLPPTTGRIQVQHTDATSVTYSVSLECVKG
jgi:hypothetical protein